MNSSDQVGTVGSGKPRSGLTGIWRLVLFVVVAAVFLGACGGPEATSELASDPNDVPPDGPLPTAPTRDAESAESPGFSGDVDVNELILRIDSLNEERDLCVLLTGEAMADITGGDINLTSLVSNPAGFTQLFAALEKVFGHMISIAADDLKPALSQMQSVWRGMSTIDPRAADAQAQAKALIESPEVQQATDGLAAWVVGNCDPEA